MAHVSMRVMTWNLWWHFGEWERRWPVIVDVIRSVAPDVVCVQEVWSAESGDDDAVRLADHLGFSMVRTDPVFFRGQSFGNAVLSRWPVERTIELGLPGADGRPAHRRLVVGAVDTPWGRWPVGSTHLDFPADASTVRQEQVRSVMQAVADSRSEPLVELPTILGADLNCEPDSDEVRILTGRSPGVSGIAFGDAWEQVGPECSRREAATWRRTNPHAADSAWPDRRLDYLLVAWPRPKPTGNPVRAWLAATEASADGTWPSDHAAVVAEFRTPDD